MTPPPSRSIRRRRWLVVMATVLALVALRTWWYWPRIDERLVGTWTISGPDIWGHIPSVEFERNGSVQRFMYRSDNGIRTRTDSNWWMAGNQLIVASPRPSIRDDWFLEFWLAQALGNGDDFRFEILEIGPSILRLHEPATGIDSVYVR